MGAHRSFTGRCLMLCLALVALPATADDGGTSLPILCYHDVRDDVEGDLDEDEHAVSTRALVEQFDWLLAHDYTPVSADQMLAAERGEASLPERPILLTFDDGYASFHDRVLPLLRAYRFPAVLSVVGSWLEVPADGAVDYGGRKMPRSRFLTWEQLHDVAASPWVEVASHSYDLHNGLPANAQGNTQPAANSRVFDAEREAFETLAEMRRRVRRDLLRNRELLEERLGRAPRIIAWPYGEAAGWAFDVAREVGFDASLLLGDELVPFEGERDRHHVWQRILVQENPGLGRWVWQLRAPAVTSPIRALHARLSALESADGDEAELSRLLERVSKTGVGAVYVTAGVKAGAGARAANRIAWQLRTRTGVHVWLRLPAGLEEDALAEWASFVPVRGWLLETSDATELERAREILARYRTVARVAAVAGTLQDGMALLHRQGSVDHVVVAGPTAGRADSLPGELDPALRHRVVFHFGSVPTAERLDALQERGWLSLSVPWPAAGGDALEDLRPWISADSFPYPPS